MRFVRVCPRCAEPSGPTADYCSACGYRIVLYADRSPKRKQRKTPSVQEPKKRHCIYCGWLTKNPSRACSAHDDLPALELELLLGS